MFWSWSGKKKLSHIDFGWAWKRMCNTHPEGLTICWATKQIHWKYELNCDIVIMLQIHFLHKSLISAILSNDERFTPDLKICIKIKYILFQTKLVNFPSIYINSKQTSAMFACKLFLFQRIHLFIFHSIKMVLFSKSLSVLFLLRKYNPNQNNQTAYCMIMCPCFL